MGDSAKGSPGLSHLFPSLERFHAFSDAVFAIAITLLVLELHVPSGQEALVKGLEHEWPRYLGYFVSFAFIGGVWIAHSKHDAIHQGRRPCPHAPRSHAAVVRLVPAVYHGDRGDPPVRVIPSLAAAVVGAFLPVTAVVIYLAVPVLYVVEPLWHIRIRIRRAPSPG